MPRHPQRKGADSNQEADSSDTSPGSASFGSETPESAAKQSPAAAMAAALDAARNCARLSEGFGATKCQTGGTNFGPDLTSGFFPNSSAVPIPDLAAIPAETPAIASLTECRHPVSAENVQNARKARRYELRPAAAAAGLVNCAISERSFGIPEIPDSSKSKETAKSDFLQFVYDQAPVVGFRVMKNDVVTVRAARYPDELADRLVNAGPRGKIEYLSGKSRRRLALVAGNSPVVFRSFVTLSYPAAFPCDGKLVKKHLHAVLAALRRKCRGMEYLWFLEFQRRGAPHLHLFLSAALPEPLSVMKRKAGRVRKECRVHWPWQDWLSERWFEIVGSGDELHLRAGAAWEVIEKPDGAARYVAKESYKTFQKHVPKSYQDVGRFWGVSRGVSPDDGEMVHASAEQMAALFGSAAMDPNGNPFPVLFSGAAAYESVRDTVADPAKFRAWKSGPKSPVFPFTHSIPISAPCSAMQRLAKDQWHGSCIAGSLSSPASNAKGGLPPP